MTPESRANPPVLLCLALLAVACGGPDRDEPAASDDSSRELRLVEELRLDGHEEVFGVIPFLAVSGDGVLAVAQSQDRSVRFYARTGELLGVVGRQGDGPGEFRSLTRMGWSGDTLWVWDRSSRRLSLFAVDPPGFSRSVSVPSPADIALPPEVTADRPVRTVDPHARGADGAIYARVTGPEWETSSASHVRLSSEGRYEATLERHPLLRTEIRVFRGDDGFAAAMIPYVLNARFGFNGDGTRSAVVDVVVGEAAGDVLAVRMTDAEGDPVYSRTWPFDAVPIPPAVADSIIAARLERSEIPELRQAFRETPFPPVYPPLVALVVGMDGTLWLRLRDREGSRPYGGIDPRGNSLGTLMLDTDAVIGDAAGDDVWTIERDELGVPSIVRYGIRPAETPGRLPISER